jgi:trk system potassium uptake protein TrkH
MSPHALLAGSFVALIAAGTILLCLPWAHLPARVGLIDALFTATSAVCVTGLIVVDTGRDFTPAGQAIIMVLIQAGGLGVMTFAALAFQVLGRRMSLASMAAVQDALFQREAATEFGHTFKHILAATFAIELLGAMMLFGFLNSGGAPGASVFSAAFHAISAFCNAGFSLNTESLIKWRGMHGAMAVFSLLIVLGGLGHTVLVELARRAVLLVKNRGRSPVTRLSLNSRVVLTASGALILAGAILILISGQTPAEGTVVEKVSGAVFQSVTARTAGFNSVNIGALPGAALFALIGLMFVGGSPGSCAGGVKTTTTAIWLARVRASLRGEARVHLFDRQISDDLVARAGLLVSLAVLWNAAGLFLLLITEARTHAGTFLELLFEQISAFGTVGLSTGVTARLSTPGRLWIILTMFVGRTGPLTLAIWMVSGRGSRVQYPKGTVMIG